MDIYSRFLFEKEVLERRARAELSADDLCDIMNRAQAAAYGDALDERFRHPYMWTWKPHYYIAELDFYNFPYAFGLLFGTGLYAVYRARGAAFVPDYEKLLASTGESIGGGPGAAGSASTSARGLLGRIDQGHPREDRPLLRPEGLRARAQNPAGATDSACPRSPCPPRQFPSGSPRGPACRGPADPER